MVQVGFMSLLVFGAAFVATDGQFEPSSIIGGHCDSTCFNDYEDPCPGGTACGEKLKHCMSYGEEKCYPMSGTGQSNNNCNKLGEDCGSRPGCNCGT